MGVEHMSFNTLVKSRVSLQIYWLASSGYYSLNHGTWRPMVGLGAVVDVILGAADCVAVPGSLPPVGRVFAESPVACDSAVIEERRGCT
jgi:hypothetical protein